MENSTRVRATIRMAAPWFLLAVGVMVLELFLDLVADIPYHRLVVDQSELSPDVGSTDGLVTLIGVVAFAATAGIAWFTSAATSARDGLRLTAAPSNLAAPLAAIGAATVLLLADDALRGHEGLSNATGVPEPFFLAVHAVIVIAIVVRWGPLLLPELPLAGLFLLGFGGSFAFDLLVEDILELEFAGEVFIEENLKLVGILALLGMVVHLARRALSPPVEGATEPHSTSSPGR